MSQVSHNSSLHRFAVLTVIATLLLLGAGGLVTSHGAGMAVPDWPNTYGYNLFLFPISQWIGGVFYEHTHRLIASGVGLLTGILALWFYGTKARPFMRWFGVILVVLGNVSCALFPQRLADGIIVAVAGLLLSVASFGWPRCAPSARWLRRLGLIAFFGVVVQGVLGGLRVVLFQDEMGIFHATLAQLFFVLLCAIALFTSKWWGTLALTPTLSHPMGEGEVVTPLECSTHSPSSSESGWTRGSASLPSKLMRWLAFGTTVLILLQLILGATMRHQHAGLAIPDFPLAYGKLWPSTDPVSVEHYNAQRIEVTAANPITAFQIQLQMTHRILAVLILLGVAACAWQIRKDESREAGTPNQNALKRLSWLWLGLILGQVVLGAATILSNKAADIATAHVLVGALSLATGVILCIVSSESLQRVAARSAAQLSSVTPEPGQERNLRPDAGSTSKAAATAIL